MQGPSHEGFKKFDLIQHLENYDMTCVKNKFDDQYALIHVLEVQNEFYDTK